MIAYLQIVLHLVLFFHETFAWDSNDKDPGMTSGNNHVRKKRLVYGQLVYKDEQGLYPLTRYQATIIGSHFCNEALLKILKAYLALHPGRYDPTVDWSIPNDYIENMIFTHCPVDKSRSYCGGAAITEYAIQTACHCIARFDTSDKGGNVIAKSFNAWEDLLFMFVGALAFERGNTPYVSKNFIIHQRCEQHYNLTISHNIGIIVLRYKLQAGTVIAAPTSLDELVKQWYYVVEKEAVCLLTGWGSTEFEGRDIYGLPSYNLRKTWRVVRSFVYCWETHTVMAEFVSVLHLHDVTYKQVQTWSCTTDFGKMRSSVGHGDAGGPISCVQGWYFGVINWGTVAYDKNDSAFFITTNTDIVYALYENAWEFRPSFNSYIRDFFEEKITPKPEPTNVYKRQIYIRDLTGIRESPLSRGTDSDHSCLLSLIIFTTFLLLLLRCLQ